MKIDIRTYELLFGRKPEDDLKKMEEIILENKRYYIEEVKREEKWYGFIRHVTGTVKLVEIHRIEKFKICYLSDIPSRIQNARDYFTNEQCSKIISISNDGFETDDTIFKFIDCSDFNNYVGIKADKAIIDFREPMRRIASVITVGSRYPADARITDDRRYGIMDRR